MSLLFLLEVLPLKFEPTFDYSSLKPDLSGFSALTPNFSSRVEKTEIKKKKPTRSNPKQGSETKRTLGSVGIIPA